MEKKKSQGLFSSLPQKAKVLGAKFVNAGGKQSIEISYQYQGEVYTHSLQKGGYAI